MHSDKMSYNACDSNVLPVYQGLLYQSVTQSGEPAHLSSTEHINAHRQNKTVTDYLVQIQCNT